MGHYVHKYIFVVIFGVSGPFNNQIRHILLLIFFFILGEFLVGPLVESMSTNISGQEYLVTEISYTCATQNKINYQFCIIYYDQYLLML